MRLIVAGIDFLVVQYKGGTDNMVAIGVGDAQLGFNAVTSSLPHMQSGRRKALAFGGLVKSTLLPGTPTISESGLAGYEAGTPKKIIDKRYKELIALLQLDEIKKAMENQGAEAEPRTPAEFGQFIAAETVMLRGAALRAAKGARGPRGVCARFDHPGAHHAAQDTQLFGARRRRGCDRSAHAQIELGVRLNVADRVRGMNRIAG